MQTYYIAYLQLCLIIVYALLLLSYDLAGLRRTPDCPGPRLPFPRYKLPDYKLPDICPTPRQTQVPEYATNPKSPTGPSPRLVI